MAVIVHALVHCIPQLLATPETPPQPPTGLASYFTPPFLQHSAGGSDAPPTNLHHASTPPQVHPELDPGDVVLFSEATAHGATPWRGAAERRIALYRFTSATMAYGRGYRSAWPEEVLRAMTAPQRAVLDPPYATRLNRKVITGADADSAEAPAPRDARKVELDRRVFGADWF